MLRRYSWVLIVWTMLMATACSSSRKVVAADEAPALTTAEQRRYEYYFLEAIRLEQQECYDEAFEMLRHCLEICPTAPSALYKTATYLFFLNNKEQALEALLKSVEIGRAHV